MRITKEQLRQIIKEELEAVMSEESGPRPLLTLDNLENQAYNIATSEMEKNTREEEREMQGQKVVDYIDETTGQLMARVYMDPSGPTIDIFDDELASRMSASMRSPELRGRAGEEFSSYGFDSKS